MMSQMLSAGCASGRTERLGSFRYDLCTAVRPDGNKLIMSLAEDGQTDIFEMDGTQGITQLTCSASIDITILFPAGSDCL